MWTLKPGAWSLDSEAWNMELKARAIGLQKVLGVLHL